MSDWVIGLFQGQVQFHCESLPANAWRCSTSTVFSVSASNLKNARH